MVMLAGVAVNMGTTPDAIPARVQSGIEKAMEQAMVFLEGKAQHAVNKPRTGAGWVRKPGTKHVRLPSSGPPTPPQYLSRLSGRLLNSVKGLVDKTRPTLVRGRLGSNLFYAAIHEFAHSRSRAVWSRKWLRPTVELWAEDVNDMFGIAVQVETVKITGRTQLTTRGVP